MKNRKKYFKQKKIVRIKKPIFYQYWNENLNIQIIITNKNSTKKFVRLTENKIKKIKKDLMSQTGLLKGLLLKEFSIIELIKYPNIRTNKGILVRMGKGKGKIIENYIDLKLGDPVLELKQKVNHVTKETEGLIKIKLLLNKIKKKYPFLSFKFKV